MKEIVWMGRSKEDLKVFSSSAQNDAGYELYKVQIDLEPTDWKPMATVGAGVKEIRIRDETGSFRVIYVANIGASIYVLHCFKKKTQKTSLTDLRLAQERYKQIKR